MSDIRRVKVQDLNDAFEKQGIDMTFFKPNQFAALSVYHAQFLTQVTNRTKHWLNRRYCCGLKQYVPGNEIETQRQQELLASPGNEIETQRQQELLASQCLPKHYEDSSISQPAGLEQSGQAIASALVVCELCHIGLSGFDTFHQHCRRAHKSFAEYRKRAFYKAREAGLQPVLLWLKRQMAHNFQFSRFFCAPGTPSRLISDIGPYISHPLGGHSFS